MTCQFDHVLINSSDLTTCSRMLSARVTVQAGALLNSITVPFDGYRNFRTISRTRYM